MGNRQGNRREEGKSKGDKKCEEESQKGRKRQETSKKTDTRKKRLGHHVSEVDTDIDESSHVTGGDSESGVFKSAENISYSPYLDSSTRSEHEHGTTWSGMFEHPSTDAKHPYILSSKDFHDGFSLEACIPPEIARPETYTDVSPMTWSRHRQSNQSFNSSADSQSRAEVKSTFSGSSSPAIGGCLHSTPHTTTSSTGGTERPQASNFPTLVLTPLQETDRVESQEMLPSSPAGGHHHPHFYNHNRKYQHTDLHSMPKPSSPQPQRRALSPKITSSSLKSTSSDNSSTVPSTPASSRRAANFLALFRSSSKPEKGATYDDDDHTVSVEARSRIDSTASDNIQGKVKFKSVWKTWERPRSKKSKKQTKVSIFGTSRKTDNKPDQTGAEKGITDIAKKEETKQEKRSVKTSEYSFQLDSDKNLENQSETNFKSTSLKAKKDRKVSGTVSTSSDSKSNTCINTAAETGEIRRESGPPLSKTAAFCILKLEELERSIEKTIREKFPDAEPFLLRRRSKEELRGSRSLPTTPSLKKKLYVARDEDAHIASSRPSDDKDTTKFYDETYESPPSPARSPVVLRRFGARTRHASISPKIPRAKTATLFNSPSEISSFDAILASKPVSKVPQYQRLSAEQTKAQILQFKPTKPISAAQKSESKYDNVMDDEDSPAFICSSNDYYLLRHGQLNNDGKEQVNDTVTRNGNRTESNSKPVIIPTFSAVFGSVSPKLKRHLQVKFNEMKDITDKDNAHTPVHVSSQVESDQHKTFNKQPAGRREDEEFITKRGLAPSLFSLDSSENAAELMNQNEMALEGRSPKLVHQHMDTINEKRNREQTQKESYKTQDITRIVSVPGNAKSVNRTVPGFRSANGKDADVNFNENTVLQVLPGQRTTGKLSNESEEKKKAGLLELRKSPRDDILPSTQPQNICRTKIAAKSGQLTFPGTAQQHSTDHVVFDSNVALPCHVFPSSSLSATSPGQETVSNVNNSSIAQAQVTTPHQGQHFRHVKKQNSVLSLRGETAQLTPHCPPSGSAPDRTTLSDTVTVCSDTPPKTSYAGITEDVSFRQGDSAVVSGSECSDSVEAILNQPNSVFSESEAQSDFLGDCESSFIRTNVLIRQKIDVLANVESNNNHQLLQTKHFEHQQQQHEENNFTQSLQHEAKVSVLRQPVSEVISQMISLSKRQPLQQEIHLQHQQQRLLQTNSALPDYGVMHAKPAVAIVTKPNNEQTYKELEKKTVIAIPNSPTITFSSDLEHSRSQEIQTDSYTTADKSVDSNGLTETIDSSKHLTTDQSVSFLTSTSKTDLGLMDNELLTEVDNTDERQFLKMTPTGSKQFSKKHVKESRIIEQVPPPSPTAMQQLIEEFDEEDDVDETNKETVASMSRENEMKQFTETVYKRLSDLLGSQSRDELDDDSEQDVNDDVVQDLRAEMELSPTFERDSESISSNKYGVASHMGASASLTSSGPTSGLVQILTIETSSSLTTTTSSDSDIDETPLMFQSFQNDEHNEEEGFNNTESCDKRQSDFREFDKDRLLKADDSGQRPTSREYHSDDDVATGRGIPDYYDDRPLWTRRQKQPSQLSAAMMAIRWRERRERWLKKRRRNRTEIMSAGSSDTGSENYPTPEYSRSQENASDFDIENDDTRTHDMGSGILTSPKYTKPILPFFGSSRTDETVADETSKKAVSGNQPASPQYRHRHERRGGHCHTKQEQDTRESNSNDNKYEHEQSDNNDDISEHSNERPTHSPIVANTDMTTASIEDTFQELRSVQNILMGMQDLNSNIDDNSDRSRLLSLTTENVRSIREFYKDFYVSGNGRRSRMSATDRTESDLDLYSEIRDDASSDSEVYADDEGDDDGLEPYATAEDDLGATGRGSSAGGRRDGSSERDEEDDAHTNVVLSCTFYNSNPQRDKLNDQTEAGHLPVSPTEAKTTHRSISAEHTPTSPTVLNSDEEFWVGSAVIDESYKQLETAADAVSSTFQNAREQMHDIQYHLQALRRQMEVMQDDLTSVSLALSPNRSVEYTKK